VPKAAVGGNSADAYRLRRPTYLGGRLSSTSGLGRVPTANGAQPPPRGRLLYAVRVPAALHGGSCSVRVPGAQGTSPASPHRYPWEDRTLTSDALRPRSRSPHRFTSPGTVLQHPPGALMQCGYEPSGQGIILLPNLKSLRHCADKTPLRTSWVLNRSTPLKAIAPLAPLGMGERTARDSPHRCRAQ